MLVLYVLYISIPFRSDPLSVPLSVQNVDWSFEILTPMQFWYVYMYIYVYSIVIVLVWMYVTYINR